FINTGQYDTDRDFVKTISPSMDILVSSNLERFIYQISDGNEQLIKDKMNNLKENKKFEIEKELVDAIKEIMIADYVTEEETLKTIKACFEKTGYLLDPHTAVAYSVSENLGENILIVSTASPYKFGESILKGLDINTDGVEVEGINFKISQLCKKSIPKSLVNISEKEIKHHRICGINEIEKTIKEILKVGSIND
ncbi:MAG: threonine synthase, partial [Bacillota bacterium]|nr:threonine synthase [Bacillota bacterium]